MKKYNSNAAERALFRNIISVGDNVKASWAAMIVQPDGSVEMIGLEGKQDFSFDRFKYAMGMERGTCLEMIEASLLTMLADVTIACFVDEDGLANKLEPNPCASVFAGQDLVGPALFINKDLFLSMDSDGPDFNTTELEAINEAADRIEDEHDTVLEAVENGVFGEAEPFDDDDVDTDYSTEERLAEEEWRRSIREDRE